MAYMAVRTDTNETIIDTNYIHYGLLASGSPSSREVWYGKILRGINSPPDKASSWVNSGTYTDNIYAFTASSCVAPIIYVVGQCFLEGVEVSGASFTWLFSGVVGTVKVYVFDHMRAGGSGPVLRASDTVGNVTFNSRMVPLNVLGTVSAPANRTDLPPNEKNAIGPTTIYVGGTTVIEKTDSATYHALTYVDVATGLTEEIAVNAGFTRGARVWPGNAVTAYGPHSVTEYAYGNGGSVRFAFRSGAANYLNNYTYSNYLSTQFSNIPTVIPAATFITTGGLPFPFQL